jgi:hypothetical protein
MAESEAAWGDFASALRWLTTIEWLDGALTADLQHRRLLWTNQTASAAAAH